MKKIKILIGLITIISLNTCLGQNTPKYFKEMWVEFQYGTPDFGQITFNVKGYNLGKDPNSDRPNYNNGAQMLFWDGAFSRGYHGNTNAYTAGVPKNKNSISYLTEQNVYYITMKIVDDGYHGNKGFPTTSTASAVLFIKLSDGRLFSYWDDGGPRTFKAGDKNFDLHFVVHNSDFN